MLSALENERVARGGSCQLGGRRLCSLAEKPVRFSSRFERRPGILICGGSLTSTGVAQSFPPPDCGGACSACSVRSTCLSFRCRAALAIKCALTGAVMNRNPVISISWRLIPST